MDYDGDGSASADGYNRVLFSSYFDVTRAADPTKNFGFQAVGTRISTLDGLNENVICHGIVTDGLIGEARWLDYQYSYKYGDATTGLSVFWCQAENVGGDPAVQDLATRCAFFDLAQAGSASAPLVAGTEIRLKTLHFGASDTGLTATHTRVESRYVVYNNLLIMRCASNIAGLGAEPDLWNYGSEMNNGDDITLQCVSFDLTARTVSDPHLIHGATPYAGDSTENNAMPLRQDGSFLSNGHSMYGGDEGLSKGYFFFAELVEGQGNGGFGRKANNGRLAVAEIDLVTGVMVAHAFLDAEDTLNYDTVLSTEADIRLSRNGDYIVAAWMESRAAGGVIDKGLNTAEVFTASSATPLASRVGAAVVSNIDIDTYDVTWFVFADGLEYKRGAQSNASILNIFYEQSCGTNDMIWRCKFTADLDPTPTIPIVAVTTLQEFPNLTQPGMGSINSEHWLFNGTDGGGDSEALIFFIKNAFVSDEVFLAVWSGLTGPLGGLTRIDQGEPWTKADKQALPLAMTPAGSSIAAPPAGAGMPSPHDGARDHAWTRVHTFFLEDRASGSYFDASGLFSRYWSPAATSGVSIEDQFTPSTAGLADYPWGLHPFEIDKAYPIPDAKFTAQIKGIGRRGDSAGIWFTADGNVWYQEFVGAGATGSWTRPSGDPLMLDFSVIKLNGKARRYFAASHTTPGKIPATVLAMNTFFTRQGTDDTMGGAMCFWIKDTEGDGFPRLQVRVRNDE
ncbi:MAG: hypothetical protein K8T20_02175 [Planctomycetes bacterium]|nr:hypothetical protein [Planctomycetota bacterium]